MLEDIKHPGSWPWVVVISGSTRFHKEMHEAALQETLKGRIVLVVGSNDKSDDELGITDEQKLNLEALHRHKIDLADELLVVNVNDYIGDSTSREIAYARSLALPIRFWEGA